MNCSQDTNIVCILFVYLKLSGCESFRALYENCMHFQLLTKLHECAIVPIWVSFKSSGLQECCPRRWRPPKNISIVYWAIKFRLDFPLYFLNFLCIYKNGWPQFVIFPIALKKIWYFIMSLNNSGQIIKFQLNIFGFSGHPKVHLWMQGSFLDNYPSL